MKKKLTERETEVLLLLREGLIGKEVAGELNISVRTVETYCRNIYEKLGVRNITAALYKARELQVLA